MEVTKKGSFHFLCYVELPVIDLAACRIGEGKGEGEDRWAIGCGIAADGFR
ncbi:MAG: hypothetical protein IKC63_03080 [Clostridia bacterium]|nr:hypothetical protein [Clostridia bacterium]